MSIEEATNSSTVEAEYMALSKGAKEGIWLTRLMSDVGRSAENITIPIYTDNQGSMALT